MSTAQPSPAAFSTVGDAGSRQLSQRKLGVVVPIRPIGVQDRHLLDLDHLGAGAVQHAEVLAEARLPLTPAACARMAQLEWSRQTMSEHERQQREAGLLHALDACHAQIEQQALLTEPPVAQPPAIAPATTQPGAPPSFTPRALRHERMQSAHRHPVRTELSAERWRWVLGVALALLLTAMEVSVVSQLNPVLLPTADPTAERSWMAHAAQVLAALMLVTMLGAARLLAAQAARAGQPAAQRLVCGTGAGAIAVSACLLAAIVTWAAFGPLVEALLSGQSAASGMALDSAAPAAPLWLRLLTAPALLAIGVLAGQAAHMAAQAAGQVRVLKPRLADLDADLGQFRRARQLASSWTDCCAQRLAPAQMQHQVEEACTSGFQAYLAGLQLHRRPVVAAHRESSADRSQRQANDQQIDLLASSAALAFSTFIAWGNNAPLHHG